MDIIFKGINEKEAQVIVAHAKMYDFIYEWRERIIRACKEGDHYATQSLREDFYDTLHDFGIAQLFD
jgi:hypothetical protein